MYGNNDEDGGTFLIRNNRGQKYEHDVFKVTKQQQQNANQKTIYHKK